MWQLIGNLLPNWNRSCLSRSIFLLLFSCCFCTGLARLADIFGVSQYPTVTQADNLRGISQLNDTAQVTVIPTNTQLPTLTRIPMGTATHTISPTPTKTRTLQPTSTPRPTLKSTATMKPTLVLPPPILPPVNTQPPSSGGNVVISNIYFDGLVPKVESDEYAVIMNQGSDAVNLKGWHLNAGDPGQDYYFPNFTLGAGQSCRVYTNLIDSFSCDGSFRSDKAIWNNDGDCGYLYDNKNNLKSKYCY